MMRNLVLSLCILCGAILSGAGPERGPHEQDVAAIHRQAKEFQSQNRYMEAGCLYLRALALCENGAPCSARIAILNNLGSLYLVEQKYSEAEPLLEHAVGLASQPAPQPELATALSNLASVYRAEARYADAIPLYERSLAIREKALGPENPASVPFLNSMAQLYRDLGQYTKAEELAMHGLRILAANGLEDTPEHATGLLQLAAIHAAQGDLAGAGKLSKQVLADREKLFGATHHAVADALNDLAVIYRKQDHPVEAEQMYRQALSIYEGGSQPRQEAVTKNNLASALAGQGKWKEALELYRQAIGAWEKTLGPDHPELAAGLTNLAQLYQSRRQYDKAEPLFRRAMDIDLRHFGPDHERVALDLNNAGALAVIRKHYAVAEPLLLRALRIFENRLPPGHPDIGTSADNLAEFYRLQGNFEAAENFYRQGVTILQKAWGPQDRRLLGPLDRYAIVLRARKDFAEAAKVDMQAVRIRVVQARTQVAVAR